MKLLEGKVALITGGTRGIGKGIVEVSAAQGAKVAFTYAGSVEKAQELGLDVIKNESEKIYINAVVLQSTRIGFFLNSKK